MRDLTNSELMGVSGGLYCTDKEGFTKIVWNAAYDGLQASGILSTITGAVAYSGMTYATSKTTAGVTGVAVGLFLAPVYAIVGMYYSSAWDILN